MVRALCSRRMLAHVCDEDAAQEAPKFARNIFMKTARACLHGGDA
jgi:hypothetical protein